MFESTMGPSDEYAEVAVKARIYKVPTAEADGVWWLDGVDATGACTADVWHFETFAEAVDALPAWCRSGICDAS